MSSRALQGGYLWSYIEPWRERMLYPSIRRIAELLDVSPGTVSGWQKGTKLPTRTHLESLSVLIGVDYQLLLTAALVDKGYIDPKVSVGRQDADA